MTPEKMALYDRVSEVLGGYDVHPADRQTIIDGTGPAESWADVPDDVKKLIEEIEASPRQSWDDPADLPDQQNL